jgi:beta-N-acetylhexosaminidase
MSTDEILRDAYAVLLPAFETADFTAESQAFFDNGGVASLLGSSREEYLARRMSAERRAHESPELLRTYANKAKQAAGKVLIAIDYEIGGVHRLHEMAPQLPHPDAALDMTPADMEAFGRMAARCARHAGVNFFLAPVVDIVTGKNPWLVNRTLRADPTRVAEITSAFIRGVQSAGVAATAKHFPGHPDVPVDPHDSAEITVTGSLEALAPGLVPYRAAIDDGVKAIMTGPIPVEAFDPIEPSSTSFAVVSVLRSILGFQGLIVSDDLDLPGTMRGRELAAVAVASLKAGVELLLLSSGPQVERVASHLAAAARNGELPLSTLRAAAAKVRALAGDVALG